MSDLDQRQEHTANGCIAVVIPVLNAGPGLDQILEMLACRLVVEIIVVDGGSIIPPVLKYSLARLISAPRGRGFQLSAGVEAAGQDWLLLLHADTMLQPGWQAAARTHMASGPERAGYFQFKLDDASSQARRLERRVAWRCRALALPYGDQGLLIHRSLLAAIGGIPLLPLMEDVEMVRRLGRARLAMLNATALTSAERWRREGWRYRSIRNLLCLALYYLGVPPHRILRFYR